MKSTSFAEAAGYKMTKLVGIRIIPRVPRIAGHFMLFYIWNESILHCILVKFKTRIKFIESNS